MTGRRRRGSTSSLEDEVISKCPVHWCQESSVLRRLAPDAAFVPEFELVDAVILKQDGKTMANALDVLFDGPFIVRGTMVVDAPEQRTHLIMNVKSSIPLEVTDCGRYSVGEAMEEEDAEINMNRRSSPPVLWMEGHHAWFEINPSAEYLPIYRSICEAIRLYYSVLDVYAGSSIKAIDRRHKSSDPVVRLSDVFFQYSAKVGNGKTIREVAQMCQDLAPFLINQFILQADSDQLHWPDTYFYKWMKKENPELFAKAEDRIRNPRYKPPTNDPPSTTNDTKVAESVGLPSRTRSSRSRSAASVAPDAPVTQSQRSSRSRSALQPADERPRELGAPPPMTAPSNPPQDKAPVPAPGDDRSVLDTVIKALESAYDTLIGTKSGVTYVGLLNRLYFSSRFPTYKNGTPGSHRIPVAEVLHYNAADILKIIDPARWQSTELYPWLQKKATEQFTPVAMKTSDFPYRLVPRGSRPFMTRNSSSAVASSVVKGPLASSNKDDDDDDDDDDDTVLPSRMGKGIKTPSRAGKSNLRPISTIKKRPRSEMMEIDDVTEDDDYGSDSGVRAKKSHYFDDATVEDADMNDSDDDGVDNDIANGEDDDDDDNDDDKVRIVIRADKIPSSTPRGPNDTWTCDQEDCEYIVRGGDADECQERIRRHFEDHRHQTERVQLAMTEGRAGHLPINHLLDKIKNLGETDEIHETLYMNGVALPKPIRKKVIV